MWLTPMSSKCVLVVIWELIWVVLFLLHMHLSLGLSFLTARWLDSKTVLQVTAAVVLKFELGGT